MIGTPDNRRTRQSVLDEVAARFRAAGLDSPQTDARLLLAHVLGIDRLSLHADPSAAIPTEQWPLIEAAVQRRLAREPVHRIIGERWFYGRPFEVTPATLDPRPDTETIIDAAKTLFAEQGTSPRRILDIGTGTGCILLTLLAEFPGAVGVGTDISTDALAVSPRNAARLGLADRADFRRGPGFAPVDGQFDLIVSNPPYIPSGDIPNLDPEVRDFDPLIALDGGTDGLAVYRNLCANYSRYLSTGWFILEVGYDQATSVAELCRAAAGAAHPPTIRTFNGLGQIARCVAVSPRAVATH